MRAVLTIFLTLTVGLTAPLPSASAATTHTVDAGNPGCSDATGTPYCTIAAANARAQAGQVVAVRAATYREQVNPKSGVRYKAQGNVVMLGSDSLAQAVWSDAGEGRWTTSLLGAANAHALYRGDQLLTKALAADSIGAGQWWYDTTARVLTVNLGGPAPQPEDALDVVRRTYGFLTRAVSDVRIEGSWRIARIAGAGVLVENCTNVQVSGVHVSASHSHGINIIGGGGVTINGVTATRNASIGIRTSGTTNPQILGSTTFDNDYHGISVIGSTGARVGGNTSYWNDRPNVRVATGINIEGSAGAVVEQNTTYSNSDTGVQVYAGSTDVVVRRNVTYDNGDHGIDVLRSPRPTIVSNTVVGNVTSGINVEGQSTGATLRNNLATRNAVNSPRGKGEIRIESGSEPGTTLDRDLLWAPGGGVLVSWVSVSYRDLAAFRAATGQEPRGIAAEPAFHGLADRDLRLLTSSPGVDAADAGGAGWLAPDRVGTLPKDILLVVDTGTGSPRYADIGAFEATP